MKYLYSFFVLMLFIFISPKLQAYLLYEVSMEDKVLNSALVIEGKVISTETFWNEYNNSIYTSSRVKIYKIFKGDTDFEEIYVITEGGTIDDITIKIEPDETLYPNQTGIFFLNPSEVKPKGNLKGNIFKFYASVQGFIEYDLVKKTASDNFKKYNNIFKDLYQPLQDLTGKTNVIDYFNINDKDQGKNNIDKLQVEIFTINPVFARGGLNDIVAISGMDFGVVKGSVRFRNADNGGNDYITVTGASILTWTNTDISVRVPSNACTGTIQVVTAQNDVATSSQTLLVPYSVQSNSEPVPIFLVDMNGQGGYSFRFSTNFNTNNGAVNAFLRAMKTWRCNTFVNFGINTLPVSQNCPSWDATNTVYFSNASCALPAGVLAATRYQFGSCLNNSYMTEMDIQFSNSVNWNYDTAWSCTGCYDFESVALHELGHCHSLAHSCDVSDVMYYSVNQDNAKRTLRNESDLAGGNYVSTGSSNNGRCGRQPMVQLNSNNCNLSMIPVANFTANPLSGCKPTTIYFTDQSINNPTSWRWDIDNNDTIDYTTRNPSHTYTSAGDYSVKLIVSNDMGSDTIVKKNFIKIHPLPVVQINGLTNVCANNVYSYLTLPKPGNSYRWVAFGGTLLSTEGSNEVQVKWGEGSTGMIRLVQTVDSTGCKDSTTTIINIRPLPAPVITGNLNPCEKSESDYKSNYSSGYSNLWKVEGGTIIGKDDSSVVRVRWGNAGNGKITLNSTNDQTGCQDSVSKQVIINPNPSPKFEGINSVCINENATYTTKPDTALTNSWSVTNGLITYQSKSKDSITVNWRTAGQGSVKLIQTSRMGCKDSIILNVAVNLPPSASISGDSIVCQNAISDYNTQENSEYSYVWTMVRGGQIIGDSTKNTVQVLWNFTGFGKIRLNIVNLVTKCQSFVEKTVLVNSITPANIAGSENACSPCTETYMAQAANQTYKWIVIGGDLLTQDDIRTIKVRWNEPGEGSVMLIQANPNNGCQDSNTLKIKIAANIAPDFTGPNPCARNTMYYQSNSDEKTSTSWTVTGGKISGSPYSPKVAIIWGEPGDATIKLVHFITVKEYKDSVIKPFIINPSPGIPTITKDSKGFKSSPGDGYQWYWNGEEIPGATHQIYSPTKTGTYTVKVKNSFGCFSEMSAGVLFTDVEDNLIFLNNDIKIYPIPSTGNVIIESAGNYEGIINFEVYNLLGEKLFSDFSEITGLNKTKSINLDFVSDGIYIVKVKIANITFFKNLIIKR